MTNVAAPAIPPTSRDRTHLALAGVVVAYAVINAGVLLILPDNPEDWAEAIMIGGTVFQPTIFGLWTALGAGSILTRLPMAAASLMLLFVVPGYIPANFADTQRKDFIATVLAGFTIYAATVVLFLIFRWFTGFRIHRPHREAPTSSARVKFSIKYLLALTTIFAVVLGLTAQLKFQTTPPPPSFILGPNFFIEILVVMSSVIYAAVLPTIAVPLSILHGHPTRSAMLWPVAIWIVFMTSLVFVFIDDGDLVNTIGFMLLAQLGAIVLGALTSFPLRYCGLRLTRPRQSAAATALP